MNWILSLLMVVCLSGVSQAHDLLLPVTTEKGIGFINQKGAMVIKPKYADTLGFYDDAFHKSREYQVAPVKVGKKWGIIDHKGNFIVKPRFDQTYGEFEGMVVVRVGEKWGAINSKGKLVVPTVYDGMSNFLDGYSEVRIGEREKWYYVDSHGKLIQPKQDILPSSSSVRLPFKMGEKYGFMDEFGAIVIGPKFDQAYFFSGNACVVGINGKMGAINKKGDFIVSPDYAKVSFCDGFINVHNPGRSYLFDLNGNLLFQADVDEIRDGFVDLMAVQKNDKWGYINKVGEVKIPFTYIMAFPFGKKNFAEVNVDGNLGIIDKKGQTVITPQVGVKWLIGQQEFLFKESNLYGEMNVNGTFIRPPVYEDITVPYPEIIKCEIGNKSAYFKVTGETIWNPYNLP